MVIIRLLTKTKGEKMRCYFCDDVARHTAVITIYYFSDSIEDELKHLCNEHYLHRDEMSYNRQTGI